MALVSDIILTMPKHPTRRWEVRKDITRIIVHTTGSNNQDPHKTARYHIGPNHISKKGCPGLCYHDFITKAGVVLHCTEYKYSTWHCGLWNKSSVGVVMAFRGQTGEAPISEQYRALTEHLVALCLYLKVLPKNIRGHREVPGMFTILGNGSKKFKKTCPGMGVDLDALRHDVTCRLQRRLAAEKLYIGAIDGQFGKKSKAALKAFKPKRKYAI